MNIKKHIPNFLTCCNLLCGCLGIIAVLQEENLPLASFLIFAACIFDFFDGFVARLLKVTSPIGKELDSLADVVTFGVLPGIIMYKLLEPTGFYQCFWDETTFLFTKQSISLLIPIFSALRLAKFNIDTQQSESFIGVPTPANAILIASFPLIIIQEKFTFATALLTNAYCLLAIALIMSYLLIAELPLFALKFKNFSWADNKMKYLLLVSAVILLILLQWAAIPLIISLYILLSFIENKLLNPKKV